ncbi:integrase arm-type DNA-binding domain-containing protein [Acuticoccus sp. MNP-M23]|uniref:tyrosine-type recombinase/integrase n=1 Tax=Acuticoccus sp. MNP-M23 TaxID=3072793 RepID=UPI002815687D|nr:integrase arm-type DNA-binding domain-containing protein [Acuticoccus sp. MNP-M23]WMS43446.1 integrase arm-type DNA-binding domain-containing protein [Acuticoccus sp. MNP-M23]
MPKKARELSALDVKRLRHPGHGLNATFAVGGVDGLILQVTPTGARSWLLRCLVAGKRRHIGLGGYPDVPLAGARDRAREARELIRQGVDPVEHRKATAAALVAARKRGMTFSDAMERYLKNKLAEFRSDKHRKQWRSTLDAYAVPAVGDMLVSDIGVSDVQRILAPIWVEKNETASRLRGRVEAVLAWATVNGHRTGDNPARWRGNLDAILPKPSKVQTVEHHPALKLDEAADWFVDVRARNGSATRALEFMAVTAARSGEVRGAVWAEIDLAARLWVVPAVRMKARVEHRVPLTDDAISLLEGLARMEGSDFVFPAARGGMLSDMALSACMRRVNTAREGGYLDRRSGRPAVPHGLRSTFRDWAAERTQWPYEMAEIALAHTVGSEVERAYRRGDMLEKRRAMMASWGSFLHGEEDAANVVQMAARA